MRQMPGYKLVETSLPYRKGKAVKMELGEKGGTAQVAL